MQHIPVLLDDILTHLLPAERRAERIIDGTLGAGGHSAALLEHGAESLLGLDLDPAALAIARETLAPFGDRFHSAHSSYADMQTEAARIGWDAVDGILLDLGVSSMQLDTPERGFTFRADAPLDMRFNPQDSLQATAADLVNTLDADELADIFYRYAEEKQSRRIARAVVAARAVQAITTTGELASVIEQTMPRRPQDRIHPATRVFQALRIAVNDELTVIERALPNAIALLRPGGRLAVISFHSLEDRLVKGAFKLAATDCICPPKTPVCICDHEATVKRVTRKPITASESEIERNPRSRSARLRIVEKL